MHELEVDYNDLKDPKSAHQMKTHTGNLIDHRFFKNFPREAKGMYPPQHILLHVTCEVPENTGYIVNSTPTFRQDTFSC
ncbi:hypothetical protein OE88DRAFT_1735357 [Heliocybe sulcata]|uniref:Uncharacterized protein n=1 Tax=Heliocybe sulcata TaxID=5364 RepID=A0A5C3N5P4_9AGAM|nr:hypothetical protein OE88DRAFT_1735357 [Heliocybe sulcata]